MKSFKNGNWDNNKKCPLCGTSKDGEVALVPVIGTQEGNIIEAIQVHTECISERWYYNEEFNVIIAKG